MCAIYTSWCVGPSAVCRTFSVCASVRDQWDTACCSTHLSSKTPKARRTKDHFEMPKNSVFTTLRSWLLFNGYLGVTGCHGTASLQLPKLRQDPTNRQRNPHSCWPKHRQVRHRVARFTTVKHASRSHLPPQARQLPLLRTCCLYGLTSS